MRPIWSLRTPKCQQPTSSSSRPRRENRRRQHLLDSLKEVALLGLLAVLEQLLHIRAHSGDRDLRHFDGLPVESLLVRSCDVVGVLGKFARGKNFGGHICNLEAGLANHG